MRSTDPAEIGDFEPIYFTLSPATEAALVVAVRRPGGTIFLARFCAQVANLPGRRGERAVMMVRRLTRHGSDQAFEIVDHAVLRGRRGVRCDNGRS